MEINLSLYQVIQVTISVMKIKIGIFMNVKNLIFKIKKITIGNVSNDIKKSSIKRSYLEVK
ncbi:hypothetical protein BAU25_28435 [Bacillus albus]|uniref:Uncharacterized protein n=1 Tax=Bacillus albus TaxID=2026189 RepID=A0A1J9TNQ8_9BACI|nr:hypothetical protein BAU25_28435 [Bacillus albus]